MYRFNKQIWLTAVLLLTLTLTACGGGGGGGGSGGAGTSTPTPSADARVPDLPNELARSTPRLCPRNRNGSRRRFRVPTPKPRTSARSARSGWSPRAATSPARGECPADWPPSGPRQHELTVDLPEGQGEIDRATIRWIWDIAAPIRCLRSLNDRRGVWQARRTRASLF